MEIKKHAYLILAHNEIEIFRTLIRMIDDERNDIYVHIDKKSDINKFKEVRTSYSKIYFSERIDIRWGDISQVKAELILMEAAVKEERYLYYHIISGVDLPVNTQNYIHKVCEDSVGISYVGFSKGKESDKEIKKRTMTYKFFTKYSHSKVFVISSFFSWLQAVVGIKRKYDLAQDNSKTVIKMGCNWCSLTDEALQYILLNKIRILKEFKWTVCCDELFIQTILYNSDFKNKIYKVDSDDDYEMCMREIDWKRGNPYIWRFEDYDHLMNSKRFFARKFSSSDMRIVKAIEEKCLQEKSGYVSMVP